MTGDQQPVVLALTPVAERAIEQLLFDEHSPVMPVASVGEADELEAATREQPAVAVLLSPQLSGISTGHCERVRAMGLRLVGVALDDHDRDELQHLAVDTILTAEAATADLLAAIHGKTDEPPTRPAAARRPSVARRTGDGTALVVIGARGASGASECAVSLCSLAARRWSTVLVELDGLGGSLSVRLGTDPREGSVLGLIRAAEAGEEVVPELLQRWVSTAAGWPPVLLGPAQGDPVLAELAAPGAITTAMNALRSAYPLSVWDVGFLLAAGGEVGTSARIHREAIAAADSVLLVLGARDVHLQSGLAQLDVLLGELEVPAERLRVLVNGLGGPGVAPGRALTQALSAKLAQRGLTADAWLPWDPRALSKASRTGTPLAAARPSGAYARALARVLDELFLPDSTHARRRKLRLSAPTVMRTDVTTPSGQEEVVLPWQS